MKNFLNCVMISSVIALSGCASFSTTMLNRQDDNSLWGNSNGEFKGNNNKTRPYKGVPITLKLPTHLDVFIDEEYFLKIQGDKVSEPLENQCRLLSVRNKLIYSDKVFTVDFKRPASGTLGLTLGFDEDEQYFNSIDSKLKDDTIVASSALVAGVINSLQAQNSAAIKTSTAEEEARKKEEEKKKADAKAKKDGVVTPDSRVVAYQRFDINAIDFEQQVADFVNKHLNCCNQCSTAPTYDNAANPW